MTLGEIAKLTDGELKGDADQEITGVATLEDAQEGQISFLANPKYREQLHATGASAVILPVGSPDPGRPHILCKNPYFGFTLVVREFHPPAQPRAAGIHPSAQVETSAELGEGSSIGAWVVIEAGARLGNHVTVFPGCFIGRNVRIGDAVTIHPNVHIGEAVEIGNRVVINPGAVIGCDGFGFAQDDGVYHKIPQVGTVVIEDDVEIGANTCIDRATLGATRIRQGCKLDNLVQIGHNVEIGEHSVVAGQAGISGSTKLGHHCMLGGQAGVTGHVTIGDYAAVGAQGGVTRSVEDRQTMAGYPARPVQQELKIAAAQTKLPELLHRVRALEKRLEQAD